MMRGRTLHDCRVRVAQCGSAIRDSNGEGCLRRKIKHGSKTKAAYSSAMCHGVSGALAFALKAGGDAVLADRGGNGGSKSTVCITLISTFKACVAVSRARGGEGKALADPPSLFVTALADSRSHFIATLAVEF